MNIFSNCSEEELERLLVRPHIESSTINPKVAEILKTVRSEGDSALRKFALDFDKVNIENLCVSEAEIKNAADEVSDELKNAINTAAENIKKFHSAQRYEGINIETSKGVRCVQKSVAINRVGLYVPGGSAPLFSTVLMLAIPANIAGCKEIVLCTPPDKLGAIAPAILYTAGLCGVTQIFKVGGAQAIGAMAYGTQSIPKVDKIFGPGNQYVTAAKQQVSLFDVAIDMPAGPSEVMVMADSSARADFVAADLLSQAEHGGDSQAILLTDCEKFAKEVECEVSEQIKSLTRRAIAEVAIANSRIIVLKDREQMIKIANSYAAEHLIISMESPWDVADKITAAGSVFIGNYTPESAGDYASGTNHTLPTNGWARSYSGVNLDSFSRKITYQEISEEGISELGKVIEIMALAEGLDAHANAAKLRVFEQRKV